MAEKSEYSDFDDKMEEVYGTCAVQAAVGRLILSFSRVELALNVLHTLLCEISDTKKGRKIKKIEEKIKTCSRIVKTIQINQETKDDVISCLSLCDEISIKRNWVAHGALFPKESKKTFEFRALRLESDFETKEAYGELENIELSMEDIDSLFKKAHTAGSNLINCAIKLGSDYNFWIDQTTP